MRCAAGSFHRQPVSASHAHNLKALILPVTGICGPGPKSRNFPVLYIEIFSSGLVTAR